MEFLDNLLNEIGDEKDADMIKLFNDIRSNINRFTRVSVDKLPEYAKGDLQKAFYKEIFKEEKELFIYEMLTHKYINKYVFMGELDRLLYNSNKKLLKENFSSISEEIAYYIDIMVKNKFNLYDIIKNIIKKTCEIYLNML